MLYLSTLLIEHKDVETFDEFLEVVRQKAVEGEMFIRFDLKPPFPDTPEIGKTVLKVSSVVI